MRLKLDKVNPFLERSADAVYPDVYTVFVLPVMWLRFIIEIRKGCFSGG